MITGRTRLIVHLGFPTESFKAPMIYNPWFDTKGIDAVVVPVEVEPPNYPTLLRALFKTTNVHGALVTMPHKVTTTQLVDEMTTTAKIAGACNAILRRADSSLLGDMFDGAGFVRGVERKGRPIAGTRALVVGCGGVGSAIAASLAAAGAVMISLYDPVIRSAEALADRLRQHYPSLQINTGSNDPMSFTGGPTLRLLEERWGARRAVAFHCLVDDRAYRPIVVERRWLLGYLGTYSDDRQPAVERLLLEPARALPRERFVVVGPRYPASIAWPANVDRIEHLPPAEHAAFYAAQRFTLNVTRADMVRAGWSPSVRLFEAAACAVPAISDPWAGLDSFFVPGEEILVAASSDEAIEYLVRVSEAERRAIGAAARRRVRVEHTARHRVEQLEALVGGLVGVRA